MGGRLDGAEEIKKMVESPRDKVFVVRQHKHNKSMHVFNTENPYVTECGQNFKAEIIKGNFSRLKSSTIKSEIEQVLQSYDRYSCNQCEANMRSMEVDSRKTELGGVLLEWNRMETGSASTDF